MSRINSLLIAAMAIFLAAAGTAGAQSQYIGYVYPAGGQQGSTFPIRLGGQGLAQVADLIVSGEGVSARLVDYYRMMSNEELGLISRQLEELRKKETVVDDVMAARLSSFEFPAPIGPSEEPRQGEKQPKGGPPKTEKEVAKEKLIDRIQRIFAADERMPAVWSQAELVFAEITVSPNAKPGLREIRVVTKLGVSNPVPFFVGQVPEVARKPMKTCQLPILGKEFQAQRRRPPEEEELRVTLPCTMNGQVASGEVNRYRFQVTKGQHLVISARARELGPFIADGVPGWFQAVLRLRDSCGR